MSPLHFRNQRRNEQLTARRIKRAARNHQRSFDAHAGDKAFLKARGETVQEGRIDGVDRHDTDVGIHLVVQRSPRTGAILAGSRQKI
jgi:hypothetical protein